MSGASREQLEAELRRGVGSIHFAGEHTCYAFVGYMEGALTSGLRVSRRLIERDQ